MVIQLEGPKRPFITNASFTCIKNIYSRKAATLFYMIARTTTLIIHF